MTILAKAGVLSLAAMILAGSALARPISVEANKTVPVRLKGAASSVVLGNQNVADVAVHNEHLIFVTGKSFGTTNLLVFDEDGNQIFNADVVVTVNASNMVTVNRSGSNYTYDCAPQCRAITSTGDDVTYFQELLEQQKALQELNEGN